jgi:hypothetical protein
VQTAARIYADELVFRKRLCDLLQRTLDRLFEEFEAGLTTPSTSAALAKAIGYTVDKIEGMNARIREIEAVGGAGDVEALLHRMNVLTGQLRELRSSRIGRRIPAGATGEAPAGAGEPRTPTSCGLDGSETATAANSNGDSDV